MTACRYGHAQFGIPEIYIFGVTLEGNGKAISGAAIYSGVNLGIRMGDGWPHGTFAGSRRLAVDRALETTTHRVAVLDKFPAYILLFTR